MDEVRVVTSSGFVVTPETIASRNFTTGFRGFDQAEVRSFLKRVSEELGVAAEREAQLRHMLQDAENRAAHPEVDENVLTAALGEQAARLLGSAREQAASIRAEAEAKASRLIRDTEAQIGRVRSEADSLLARRVEEVDGVTANLRNAAEADAKALREHAKAEAEAEIQAAKTQGREMVGEARAVRERILADLARRRHIAEIQLDQLRAARERLLEAYALVRRTLDEATQELKMAEVEARLAADEVGRRAGPPPPPAPPAPPAAETEYGPPTGPQEVVSADSPLGADPPPSPASAPPPAAALAPPPPPPPPPPDRTAGSTRLRATREAGGRPDPRVRPPTRPDESRPAAWRRTPEGEPRARPARQQETPRPAPTGAPPAGRSAPAAALPEAPSRTPSPPSTPSIKPRPVPPPPARLAPVAAPAEPTPPAGGDADKVDALFARIKADRASDVARSSAPAEGPRLAPIESAESPAPVAEAEAPAEAKPAVETKVPSDKDAEPSTPPTVADEAARTRRDELLDPAESSLARQLKRGLQDEQNEVLDQLRRLRRPTSEAVLLPLAEHTDKFRNLAVAALEEAVRAGTRFVDPAAGDDAEREKGIATEVATALAGQIVEPLRERLERSLDGRERSDDAAQLAESVSAVYRQWRAQELEPLARHSAAVAFARGVYARQPEGAGLRWLVDDDGGPCPDCDDNVLAGTVSKGEPYPTGQIHPPAHPGCRCLLLPAVP